MMKNPQIFQLMKSPGKTGSFQFLFQNKVLVWCSLKPAENELKTTYISDLSLSLAENAHIQKGSYSACFQAKNQEFKNLSKELRTLFFHTYP